MGFFKKPYKIKIFLLFIFFLFLFIKFSNCSNTITSTSLHGVTYTFPSFDELIDTETEQAIIYPSSSSNTLVLCICSKVLASPLNIYTPYIIPYENNTYTIWFTNNAVLKTYRLTNNTWTYFYTYTNSFFQDIPDIVYTTPDVTDNYGDPIFNNNTTKYPTIGTTLSDLESLNFDALTVNAWDYSTEDLYLLCYDNNYENTDSLYNLYPVKAILLNQQSDYFVESLSSEPDINSIYWIPKNNIGFNWAIGNKYSFRFAIRKPVESEFSDWAYEYLTEPFIFTISSNVTQQQIEDLNQQTKEFEEEQRHNETIDSINKQTEQDQNFYNTITSNDYNQNQAGDTLNNVSSNASQLDDSNYIGLFSTIFSKLSTIFNSDYNTVSTIEIPFPFSQSTITLRSDIVESRIKNTFLGLFIQLSYMFYFGLYVYRFGYNIVKSAKDGSVLNGIKNQTEVITDSLL